MECVWLAKAAGPYRASVRDDWTYLVICAWYIHQIEREAGAGAREVERNHRDEC